MKVRVYYDGYHDVYLPQGKLCGIWFTFHEFDIMGVGALGDKVRFRTKTSAVEYFIKLKAERKTAQESEVAAKERSKKSGVVYEDVI